MKAFFSRRVCRGLAIVVAMLVIAGVGPGAKAADVKAEAQQFIDQYTAQWLKLRYEYSLADWERVNYSELREVALDSWHTGPVFVAGDAAHAMTPNLGQGANSAMVDALVLVRLLRRAFEGGESLESVGRAYESIRRPFVTRIQTASRYTGIIASWSSAPARFVRDRLLGFSGRFDALNKPGLLLGAGYSPLEQEFFEPRLGVRASTSGR